MVIHETHVFDGSDSSLEDVTGRFVNDLSQISLSEYLTAIVSFCFVLSHFSPKSFTYDLSRQRFVFF